MKKSKFLQSSKDMLHRNFNPAKCKTSLRLAGSRLKLLRNKKEVQVKQMKREIAQLLESGQDQTARIRVEHVIREEKMMAAYDLIEIYCELIVARLPIIESQKNCPIDLKEAIASLIFASLRCGDVPELLDVRKHFTSKYGKEFTTAAIEVRPQCGVSRLLIEKLSAVAPDGPTKIKILSAIAEEHNIQWEHKSFDEKTSPPDDLLGGPSTFVNQSAPPYFEPQHFETPHVQTPSNSDMMHSSPMNFSQQDPRTSIETGKFMSVQNSGVSSTFQPESRPPGDERTQTYQPDGNSMPPPRQSWNMEFKDATAAAEAAAESAERASMAAKAAAELAGHGRIIRRYSTESHKSDVYILKDEKTSSGEFYEESANKFSSERIKLPYEQSDGIKHDEMKASGSFKRDGRGGTEEYSQSASLKSKASKFNDNSSDHSVPVVDEYSSKNSIEEVSKGEMSINKDSSKYEAGSVNGRKDKSENYREERIRKQPSHNSSPSRSSISDDDVNIFANSGQKFENDGVGPVVGSTEGIHESAAVVFDQSDSESDGHEFDTGFKYDEQDLDYHLPSSGQKSPEHLSSNTDSWLPKSSSNKTLKSTSSLFFTEMNSSADVSENLASKDGSEQDHFKPVTFDASDGPSSENDEDVNMHGIEHSGDHLRKQNKVGQSGRSKSKQYSPVKGKGYSGFCQTQLSLSSDDEFEPDRHREKKQGRSFIADSSENFSTKKSFADRPPVGFEDSRVESGDVGNESDSGNVEGLKFGKLTGGLRHKGYSRPPFLKNRLDEPSSFKKETESSTPVITKSTGAVDSPKKTTTSDHKKNSRKSYLASEPDSDSSEDETSQSSAPVNAKSTGRPSVESPKKTTKSGHKKNSRKSYLCSESDSDSSEDETSQSSAPVNAKSTGRPAVESPKKTTKSGHKKNSRKSYLASESDSDSFQDETSQSSTPVNAKSTGRPAVESPKKTTKSGHKKNSRRSYLASESESDSSEAETPPKISYHKQKVDTFSDVNKVETKSRLGASNSVFGSDNSDLDEDPPKEPVIKKSHMRSGISRRTKASDTSSGTNNNYSKSRFKSEAVEPDAGRDKKPTTSHVTETPKKSESQRSKWENDEQPTSAKASSRPAKSSFWGPPEQPDSARRRSEAHDSDDNSQKKPMNSYSPRKQQESQSPRRNSNQSETSGQPTSGKVASKPTRSNLWGPPDQPNSGKMQESKSFQNSAVVENLSGPPKADESAHGENPKAATLNKTTSFTDDNSKKASHVHPKLPDYDSLVQTFRLNRS